jgi:hypothetical protein
MGDTMRKSFAAFAFATFALAQPASAITFSQLTTIYIGTGVYDSGDAPNIGTVTIFNCTNVSGIEASVRFLVLSVSGSALGAATRTIPNGGTVTAATHFAGFFVEDVVLQVGQANYRGAINIESTQSAVFCSAMISDADTAPDFSFDLRLVRVNPHPGTVE